MSSLWDTWAELTRFLESARLAFARERALWESLELANREQAKLKVRVRAAGTKPGWINTFKRWQTRRCSMHQCSFIVTRWPNPRPAMRSD